MAVNQIPLNIIPRLPYSAEGFVVHNGVHDIVSALLFVCSRPEFSSHFIQGQNRSGKTHLALYLSERLVEQGSQLLEAQQLLDLLEQNSDAYLNESEQVLIIDDADQILSKLGPGDSGAFVALYEALKHRRKKLILLSSRSRIEFPCDDHVLSRLNSCRDFVIQNPDEEFIPELLEALIIQRGLQLSDKKLGFLQKRLPPNLLGLENYVDRIEQLSRGEGRINFELLQRAILGQQ